MSDVKRVFSKAPWETTVGYCRAIQVDRHIYITGTASVDDAREVAHPGDPYHQAKRCFEIIAAALDELGHGVETIVRTRMFVTNISLWESFGRAHREVFADHVPTTTMVQVSRLIHPDMLIEIEADAIAR